MVYRGKPSAACAECRKRRSRCDQGVPACGQCIKAGRTCAGYRNTTDLMFHDESKQVARRNKGRLPYSSTSYATQNTSRSYDTKAPRPRAISPIKLADIVFYQPLDELGVKFFMSNYVGNDATVSQLYYLPEFFAKTASSSPGLQQSITAAGLAGYAKTTRRKDVVDVATKTYAKAIQEINKALTNPETVAQDATLMSIIMAAMFEILIIPRISGMQNCSKHINGAVSVASLNLEQRQPTGITCKLLTTLVQCAIINSWIQHIPLPPNFVDLKQRIDATIMEPSVHAKFLDIIMELVQFRHALQDGIYESPEQIIEKALVIDNSLINFALNMPQDARFDTFRVSSEAVAKIAYDGYYHVYPQRFTAHLWNNIRSSRLRLHQVILRQCRILMQSTRYDNHASLNTQRLKSEAELASIAIEVSATVPQLAGYVKQIEACRVRVDDTVGMSHASPNPLPSAQPDSTSRVRRSTTGVNSQLLHNFQVAQVHTSFTPNHTPSTSTSFSSTDELQFDGATRTSSMILINPPPSLHHLLFQLYGVRSITHLPSSVNDWVRGRIEWLESIAHPQDLARLKNMLKQRPGDGFSVDDDESAETTRYYTPEAIATRNPDVGDRNVWFSVYNWYSIAWEQLGS